MLSQVFIRTQHQGCLLFSFVFVELIAQCCLYRKRDKMADTKETDTQPKAQPVQDPLPNAQPVQDPQAAQDPQVRPSVIQCILLHLFLRCV